MKKDINFHKVQGVTIAITPDGEDLSALWKVHLINNNDFDLSNVLISSKGYGSQDGEEQKTSVLRHMIEHVAANTAAQVETIDPAVFHLTNQYWVSYYIDREVYDKKFVFVPESIIEDNLSFIPALESKGILHE